MCQANFETATWVTSAVVAMPPSMRRGGLLAWTIAPSQVRQAYFGMMVRFTRTEADTVGEFSCAAGSGHLTGRRVGPSGGQIRGGRSGTDQELEFANGIRGWDH